MKKKLLILATFLSLISSCSKPYFVEKEDFVFDPSEYILKRDKTEIKDEFRVYRENSKPLTEYEIIGMKESDF